MNTASTAATGSQKAQLRPVRAMNNPAYPSARNPASGSNGTMPWAKLQTNIRFIASQTPARHARPSGRLKAIAPARAKARKCQDGTLMRPTRDGGDAIGRHATVTTCTRRELSQPRRRTQVLELALAEV